MSEIRETQAASKSVDYTAIQSSGEINVLQKESTDLRSPDQNRVYRSEDFVAVLNNTAKNGPIELGEKDFGKIGPKAEEVLKNAGVTKIKIEANENGGDTITAELKKPLEIDQDPAVDGSRKLKVDTTFKADISVQPDGSIKFENVEGLKAEVKALGKWRDATVSEIELRKTDDGKTEVTSTGGIGIFSKTQSRIKPGEIMEKANLLIDKLKNLKSGEKTSSLDLPSLFLG